MNQPSIFIFEKIVCQTWDIQLLDFEKFILAFDGEFTLFAGLEECLKFVRDYRFQESDIDYLRTVLPSYVENEFYEYLIQLDMKDIKIYSIPEGKTCLSFILLNNTLKFFRFCCFSSYSITSYWGTDNQSTITRNNALGVG